MPRASATLAVSQELAGCRPHVIRKRKEKENGTERCGIHVEWFPTTCKLQLQTTQRLWPLRHLHSRAHTNLRQPEADLKPTQVRFPATPTHSRPRSLHLIRLCSRGSLYLGDGWSPWPVNFRSLNVQCWHQKEAMWLCEGKMKELHA